MKIRGDGWPSVYFATILHQYVEIFWHNVCTYFIGTYVESDDNGSLICIICTQLLQFISLCLWLEQRKKVNTDFSKLRKWTKGTNIFEKDYLFVPIHDKCVVGLLLFIGLIMLVKQVFEHICTFLFKLH